MGYTLKFVTELPDPLGFEALMREYYQVMIDKLVNAGGPLHSATELAADTMAHMDDLTPPNGRSLLATLDDGTLVGCGVIRKIRPDAAEFKRMYVRRDAQGLGLGRQLFEMRIAEARNMGCKLIYADTITGNTAMLSMYEKYGFRYIPRYSENANPPELDPYLVYLEHQIL
ncbi:acetyltransferase (GNAT) family protein [Litoreibacter meonggei]|uniref:Acetyltransferase (GNAT) family protein n=1 Tax=Litoreibacter meonggei TaxID=1049199 RepID=A0A497VDC8_9RHOB|nr:GNAT family N-acetyltransferase [Litoreibacter meonggei]RLJ41302.1 acetyltransferase (GNAT) family protein [Litoreibacter meonggei]